MRILFIVPYVPNQIRTRPYNLIRALAAEGHEITLFTLVSNDSDREDARGLEGLVSAVHTFPLTQLRTIRNVVIGLAADDPLQAAYCWQPALASKLRNLLGRDEFDVVHVEHLRGARYALLAKEALKSARSATPIVWDSVDCISHLFRQASTHSTSRLNRMITSFELPRTEQYEGRLVSEFDAVLTSSRVDRDALFRLLPKPQIPATPIQVIPNGVDLERFRPDADVAREAATLILSGKMSYHANVAMALYLVRELMPLVWTNRPDVRVMIVGKAPGREVRALGDNPRVIVTGEVPDIRPYLLRATVAVAPIIYSAGIQNKILEAMACGTPVITTPEALGGLSAQASENLVVANRSQDLAKGILDLLDSPDRREAIARASLAYVRRYHDWLAIGRQLSAIYEGLILSPKLVGPNTLDDNYKPLGNPDTRLLS